MEAGPRRASRAQRVGIATLIALVSVNIWTGSPLAALWVASHVQRGQQLQMSSLVVVVAVFGALSFTLIRLLAVLGSRYETASGQVRTVRRHVPWLRSMRGERPQYPGERPQLTMLERILIVGVVVAVVSFEIWFFFLAGSSLPTWAPNAQ